MKKLDISNNPIFRYIKESKVELKKVVWPTKKETTNHTIIVIGISLALAIFLGTADYIFQKIVEFFLE